MKIILILSTIFFCVSLGSAQDFYKNGYTYDASGNRITRSLITVSMQKNGTDTSSSIDSSSVQTTQDTPTEQLIESAASLPLIYPNPTNDYITVDLLAFAAEGAVIRSVTLYDSKYTVVQKFESSQLRIKIPMATYASGKYLLTVQSKSKLFKYDIIKQ
jgi:hypothetical protein